MDKQKQIKVAEHIMSCLDKGMDLGIKNPEELEIIKAAMSAFFCIDQYKWERDVVLDQLKQLGLGLGERINGVYIRVTEIPEKHLVWYDDERSDWQRGFNACWDQIIGDREFIYEE